MQGKKSFSQVAPVSSDLLLPHIREALFYVENLIKADAITFVNIFFVSNEKHMIRLSLVWFEITKQQNKVCMS